MPPRSAESTRRRLLEAGVEALQEIDAAALVGAIGTREIAQRAGVSPATLFHHFGSVEQYAAALIDRIYGVEEKSAEEVAARTAATYDPATKSVATADYYAHDFARLLDDAEHRLRVGLCAFGGEQATSAYTAHVRTHDAAVVAAITDFLGRWQREMCPPFSVAEYVGAYTGLLNDAVFRKAADPTSSVEGSFVKQASAISMAMVRVPGDPRDLDDRMAELRLVRPAPPQAGRRAEQTRELAMHAVREQLKHTSYDELSVATVARRAHLSPATVYAHFKGKASMVVATLLDDAAGAAAEESATIDGVADFLADHLAYLKPYLGSLATSEPTADDPLLAAVTACVRGHAEDAEGLARTTLLVLVSRLVSHPGEGAAGALRHLQQVGALDRGDRGVSGPRSGSA